MSKTSSANSDFSAAPITRQKLSDQVFERLWDMIVSGELAPGDVIPSERVLMDKFGVGRPAVREALQSLANKGVITISHGERSRVNELTANIAVDQIEDIAKLLLSSEPSNLGHLKQVRKILEVGTVRIAAEHSNPGDIAKLRDIIERQESHLKNSKEFIKADIEFHTTIAIMTKNPLLQTVTQAMLTWLFEYYTPLLHWAGREDTTLLEHAELVGFIEAGNADGAANLMRNHLDRSDSLYSS